MAPDSVILIDDLALPNTGTHWWSTCIDMQMYIMHGAMERNMDQWHALLDKAGLRMLECKVYSPVMRNAIIVAVPKGREGVVNGNGNGVVNGNGVHA
jgi:demethylsterigmatocystin 6-O-methyltransferase